MSSTIYLSNTPTIHRVEKILMSLIEFTFPSLSKERKKHFKTVQFMCCHLNGPNCAWLADAQEMFRAIIFVCDEIHFYTLKEYFLQFVNIYLIIYKNIACKILVRYSALCLLIHGTNAKIQPQIKKYCIKLVLQK